MTAHWTDKYYDKDGVEGEPVPLLMLIIFGVLRPTLRKIVRDILFLDVFVVFIALIVNTWQGYFAAAFIAMVIVEFCVQDLAIGETHTHFAVSLVTINAMAYKFSEALTGYGYLPLIIWFLASCSLILVLGVIVVGQEIVAPRAKRLFQLVNVHFLLRIRIRIL